MAGTNSTLSLRYDCSQDQSNAAVPPHRSGEEKTEILVKRTAPRHRLPKDWDLISQDHRRLPVPHAHRHGTGHLLTVAFLLRSWLFICSPVCFGCTGSPAARGLSPVVPGGVCSAAVRGAPLQRLLWPQSLGSVAVVAGLQLLPGTWNLPRPGTEPMSPVSAGRHFSTAPLAKSRNTFDLKDFK